jgi:hypothetical protein
MSPGARRLESGGNKAVMPGRRDRKEETAYGQETYKK